MKKFIIISVACLSLASCSKKATNCYTCKIVTSKSRINAGIASPNSTYTKDSAAKCDMDAGEITRYEKEQSKNWKANDTLYVTTVTCK